MNAECRVLCQKSQYRILDFKPIGDIKNIVIDEKNLNWTMENNLDIGHCDRNR